MLLAGVASELGARFEPVLRRAGLVLGVAALALVVVRSGGVLAVQGGPGCVWGVQTAMSPFADGLNLRMQPLPT